MDYAFSQRTRQNNYNHTVLLSSILAIGRRGGGDGGRRGGGGDRTFFPAVFKYVTLHKVKTLGKLCCFFGRLANASCRGKTYFILCREMSWVVICLQKDSSRNTWNKGD